MDCCKFKEQMTRIIPSFAGFTAFTPTIPKMYWDVKSQEQRIFGLCKMLHKVICYADMLGENVDEIAKTLQDIEDGKLDPMIEAAIAQWFKDNEPKIMQDIEALQESVSDIESTLVDFAPDNTVKDALDNLQSNIDTVDAKIGTGFDSVNTVRSEIDSVNGQVDENTQRIDMRQSQNVIEPLLLGTILYSKENGMYDHPGSICSNGTTQYLYSQPEGRTNNNAHARVISIQNNEDNAQYQNVALAHCNSAAFDSNNGYIYIAPVFTYAGGSEAVAMYINRIMPNGTAVWNIPSPEWIMAVSFDHVTNKLYALAFSGKIYEVNEAAETFTLVKQTRKISNDEYNQDFAIYNGKFCISSPDGFIYIGTLDGDDYSIATIARTDSSYLFEWGELDGMEFNEYGNLLAIAHCNELDDRPSLIFELPIFDEAYPLFQYMIQPVFGIGTVYSLYIDQASTTLRNDGFTAAKGLKSINFVNMLADDTQRSIVLANDYTCENFRLGNASYNWISLNNCQLRVTNTMTIQTPLIINGTGKLRIANPIVVTYGITQIGFISLDLEVDTGTNLIASNPAGAMVWFGPLSSISPNGLKVNAQRTATIAASQVYILGTLTQ